MQDALPPQTTKLSNRPYRMILFLGVCLVLLVAGIASASIWGDVVALGVIEGLSEFLPISSTAHLLISAKLLGFQGSIGGTFEIFIQLGAILAVLGYYARDLLAQARAVPSSAEARRFWLNVAVAFLPAALVGAVVLRGV